MKNNALNRPIGILPLSSLLLCAFVLASHCSVAQLDGFTNRFDYSDGTAYDATLSRQDMGDARYWLRPENSRVYDGNLRMKFDQSQYGADCGIVARLKVNGDRVYSMEYRIKFDSGFDWSRGGKLPGLAGGTGPSGGGQPTDGKGFSTRYMWRENGRLVVYAYYRDQPGFYGEDWDCDLTFQAGRWYTLKQRVTVNTGNSANGRVEVWVDRVKKLDKQNLRLMTSNNTVDEVSFDTFMGGNDPSWSPDHTQYLSIDDVKVVKGGEDTPDPEPSSDQITSITVPEAVSPGTTVRIGVDYQASTERDVWVMLQPDSGPDFTPLKIVKNPVEVGSGTLNIDVPVPADLPLAQDAYQWQVFITTSGGSWDQRLDNRGQKDIDAVVSVAGRTEATLPTVTGTSFTTYPNPASEQLTVTGSDDYRVEVYDLRGQVVMQHEHLSGQTPLDIHHLRPGVYVVRMDDGSHPPQQERLIVE